MVIDPPDRVFAETATIEVGGRAVELRYLGRGHTDHDIVISVPDADVVFAGDLIEGGAVPFFNDGYPLDWPETAYRLADLVHGTVVPGHGDHAGRAFATAQADAFRTIAELGRRIHRGELATRRCARRLPPSPSCRTRTSVRRLSARSRTCETSWTEPTARRARRLRARRFAGSRLRLGPWHVSRSPRSGLRSAPSRRDRARSSRRPTSGRPRSSSTSTCSWCPTRSATSIRTAAAWACTTATPESCRAACCASPASGPVILHSDPGGSWRGVVTATNPEFRKDPGDKMGSDEPDPAPDDLDRASPDDRRGLPRAPGHPEPRAGRLRPATSRSSSTPTTPTSSRCAATRGRLAVSCCRSRSPPTAGSSSGMSDSTGSPFGPTSRSSRRRSSEPPATTRPGPSSPAGAASCDPAPSARSPGRSTPTRDPAQTVHAPRPRSARPGPRPRHLAEQELDHRDRPRADQPGRPALARRPVPARIDRSGRAIGSSPPACPGSRRCSVATR